MPTATHLPEQFGRYRIIRKLGEGGMGTVYLAQDSQLDRRVALKVPHFSEKDGPAVIERFYREARAAAAIEHSNLCPVYDVGQIDGIHYLTMPFIEGTSLADRMDRDNPWPAAQAAALVIRLAKALNVLHQRGLMHRDLKPANILLRPGDEPVIMDFGLARSLSQSDRLTETGDVIGTPAYMSPEQIQADPKAVSSATDIYSLGVIFYQLITGQLPFPGPGSALFGQILHAELQPPSALRPELDGELDAICQEALAKQGSARYATMAEFAAALQSYLHAHEGGIATLSQVPDALTPMPPPPDPIADAETHPPQRPDNDPKPPEPPQPPEPLSRMLVAGGVGTVLVVLAVVIFLSIGGSGGGSSSSGVSSSSAEGANVVVKPPSAATATTAKDLAGSAPGDQMTAKPPPKRRVTPQAPDPDKADTNSVGMHLVLIPAGSFWMGSDKMLDKLALSWEFPEHEVTIDRPFYLAAHPTTQAQFQQIMRRQPSSFSTSGGGKHQVGGLDTSRFPVERITFFDAVDFCNKLSEQEGRRPCYQLVGIQRDASQAIKGAQVESLSEGTGYRLPTEAEWEYCARAGTTTRYWFGDDAALLSDHAWFEGNSGKMPHPVGTKKANPWGLYDMNGLALAWCEDLWHETYQGAPADGRAWLMGGQPGSRLVRGGSWTYEAKSCRSADRGWMGPGGRYSYVGCRVVRVWP